MSEQSGIRFRTICRRICQCESKAPMAEWLVNRPDICNPFCMKNYQNDKDLRNAHDTTGKWLENFTSIQK